MSDLETTDEMMEVDSIVNPVSGNRKVTKSAMEKKRRARINTSLTELKTMLSGIIQLKGERFDKMEKADILEWTVKYIKDLQPGIVPDQEIPSDDKYKVGFNSCVGEVLNYISSNDAYNPEIRIKMLNHLADRVRTVDTPSPPRRCSNIDTPPHAQRCSSESPKLVNDSCFATPCIKYTEPERFTRLCDQNTETDCNNNAQSIPNLNCSQQLNQMISESPDNNQCIPKQFSQLMQMTSSPLVPTGQITILVPANIIGSPEGANCLIPIAVPSFSPNSQTILVPRTNCDRQQQQQQQISPVYPTLQPTTPAQVYINTEKQQNQIHQSLDTEYSPTRHTLNQKSISDRVAENRNCDETDENTKHVEHKSSYDKSQCSEDENPHTIKKSHTLNEKSVTESGSYSHVESTGILSNVYECVPYNANDYRVQTDVWRPW